MIAEENNVRNRRSSHGWLLDPVILWTKWVVEFLQVSATGIDGQIRYADWRFNEAIAELVKDDFRPLSDGYYSVHFSHRGRDSKEEIKPILIQVVETVFNSQSKDIAREYAVSQDALSAVQIGNQDKSTRKMQLGSLFDSFCWVRTQGRLGP